jgi:acetoin utilization deacetylase AcuC-like enzyme
MKVVFHEDFYQVYSSDPASAPGRMEAIVEGVTSAAEFVTAEPASEDEIATVHTKDHIASVRNNGLYPIAALAAGGALQSARMGLTEPCFGLVRPPGHHASAGSAWGFCHFNNMAIALTVLKREKTIQTAYVLDIDLHFGDGTVNILANKDDFTIYNPSADQRERYLAEIERAMDGCQAELIGISAGFDNHEKDWGNVLKTEDYFAIGKRVRAAAGRCGGGCFGILEGGYNHSVLGQNALALIQGLSET